MIGRGLSKTKNSKSARETQGGKDETFLGKGLLKGYEV